MIFFKIFTKFLWPTRQSSHHENENNNLFDSEQNSPLTESVDSDSGSDHELTRSRHVKHHIVESLFKIVLITGQIVQ